MILSPCSLLSYYQYKYTSLVMHSPIFQDLNSMETRRKRSGSGEIFSFPSSTPNEELVSDFEFGYLTPDSPSQDPYRTSPADHIFFNGRLLPHAFPLQPATSRGTSRTSSINSKDSLMSSRSNSTNSRSSCSSARTSSSENSEKKSLYYRSNKIHGCNTANKMITAQLYGDSQRWQYITQVPVLKREVSRRKNSGVNGKDALRAKKHGDHHQEKSTTMGILGPCLRFFRLFLLACRECHAMEPSRKQDVMHGKNLSTATVG